MLPNALDIKVDRTNHQNIQQIFQLQGFTLCFSTISFRCGLDYHAPTDCDVIKKWLTKCADDSETANYISAHTKDVSNILMSHYYADL